MRVDNPSRISEYTKKGKKDDGNVLAIDDSKEEYSLDKLIQQQDDFKHEMSLLQYHASKLGVILDHSPKCHPEIAGEGIEYAWAFSKQEYRRSPITKKRKKQKCWELVKCCFDNKGVLNLKHMRLCSKKARQYMLLYKAVEAIAS